MDYPTEFALGALILIIDELDNSKPLFQAFPS
jgi:hypothetical protein